MTDEQLTECFNYIANCRPAYEALCKFWQQSQDSNLSLHIVAREALNLARADWLANFKGKEDAPAWVKVSYVMFQTQLLDVICTEKAMFQ